MIVEQWAEDAANDVVPVDPESTEVVAIVDICSNICLCCRRVVVGLDMTKIVVGDECLGLASLLDDDFDCDCGFDCAMNDDDDDCNANGTNYVSHCWNRMNKTMNANDDGYSAIFAFVENNVVLCKIRLWKVCLKSAELLLFDDAQ